MFNRLENSSAFTKELIKSIIGGLALIIGTFGGFFIAQFLFG